MTGKRFCASPETASPGIFYQDGCLHYHDWDHAGPAGASSRNQEQRMETTKRRLLLALAGMAVARAGLARGQAGAALPAFPTRTIRIVVPFTPGSGADNSARYFGERLATQWGQAVVVENRPG